MAEVALRNVTKRFDNIEAVRSINLDIPEKEFVVLVGPSGCGKSTTLRMVAGLEEITSGNIFIDGKRVNDFPAERSRHRHGLSKLRALPAYDGLQKHGVRAASCGRSRRTRSTGACARRPHPQHQRTFGPQAEGALRRPAPARRHGARHRTQPKGVSVRRAAVKPRRQAARADAHRDQRSTRSSRPPRSMSPTTRSRR